MFEHVSRSTVSAWVVITLAAIGATCSASASPAADTGAHETASTCDVTKPNGRKAPGAERIPEAHGNGMLWTFLAENGYRVPSPEVQTEGHTGVQADGTISFKAQWRGSKKANKRLVITGKRLDQKDKPLRSHVNQGSRAADVPHIWPTYLYFPHQGCWRITAKAGHKSKLTVTVLVSVAGTKADDTGR